ncbi:MAG: Alpha/beta hydrolase [uncultured Sulfurovum sp.]|uniref:Alpha/beta hydrolase n=1 Tax=uncultured Sulfurovum sp. TaxID=269237 RepID=A0A6S6U0K6_9BACT|nr:MAG: Alpha/beta hydrolase [uncultured Sulfurovum sp.]
MKRILWGVAKPLLMLYVIGGILLYILQRDLLYKPSAKVEHNYKELSIQSSSETLKVVVLNEGKEKALIYFGGNNESVVSTAKRRANQLADFTVYLVNYRGYGGSTGSPTQDGLYADALVVYDALVSKHKELSLMGRSLGSGVATYVASKRDVEKIALITPYDSVLNVAQAKYPMYPIGLILKDKLDSVKNLSTVKRTKVLILMAEGDSIIPNEHSYALAESIPKENVQVEVIKGESHNSLSHDQKYFDLLNGFFR